MKQLTIFSLAVLFSVNGVAQNNFLQLPYAIPQTYSLLMGIDNNNKLYAYAGTSYFNYENGVWTPDSIMNIYTPSPFTSGIIFDSLNTAWFRSQGIIYKMPSGSLPVAVSSNLLTAHPNFIIKDFYADQNGNIWMCGIENGMGLILQYNIQNGPIFYSFPLLNNATPMKIRSNNNGIIWVMGRDSAFNNYVYKYINNVYSIADSSYFGLAAIFSIDVDPSGNLWVLGWDSLQLDVAIVTYNGTTYSKYVEMGSSGIVVKNLHISKNGDVWIVDDCCALFKFDGLSLSGYYYGVLTLSSQVDFKIGNNGIIGVWDLSSPYPITLFNEYGFNGFNGTVYYDLNEDGIRQNNEPSIENQKINVQPTGDFTFSNYFGYNIAMFDTSGSYTVNCNVPANWHLTNVPSSYAITHTYNGEQSNNVDFGYAPIIPFSDAALGIYITACRPGYNADGSIGVKNLGSNIINDTIELILPPGTTFGYSYPTPLSVVGNTVKWLIYPLEPFHFDFVWFTILIDSSIAIGTILHFEATVGLQTGDIDLSNNIAIVNKVVTASYDPNEKIVDYPNPNPNGYISPIDELIYTIFFQNTGTDTAFNIVVKDTISVNLDVNTLSIIGASHDYTVSVHNGLLRFDFNNILLPDSNVNELLSHGYVRYAIKPKANLANGTNISNTGYIFFDYNVPVTTNTTSNIILITAIEFIANDDNIKVYPNPATDNITIEWESKSNEPSSIQILDLAGRIVQSEIINPIKESNQTTIAISLLQTGVYILRVSDDKQNAVFKVVKE